MTLLDQLTDYIHAAFKGLWVQTQEPDEAEREIVRHALAQHWKIAVWDIANDLLDAIGKLTGNADATEVNPDFPGWCEKNLPPGDLP